MSIPKNVLFVLQIMGSVLTLGLTYVVSNQAAIIMALAIVIVWGINYLSRYMGKAPDKNILTGILFVVSLALAVIFNPGLLPPFPALPADGSAAFSVIVAYIGLVAGAATPIVGAATALYNILLADVLNQLVPKPEVPSPALSA